MSIRVELNKVFYSDSYHLSKTVVSLIHLSIISQFKDTLTVMLNTGNHIGSFST